jgi:hypothetical protein
METEKDYRVVRLPNVPNAVSRQAHYYHNQCLAAKHQVGNSGDARRQCSTVVDQTQAFIYCRTRVASFTCRVPTALDSFTSYTGSLQLQYTMRRVLSRKKLLMFRRSDIYE